MGELTAALAARCDRLTAWDVSAAAVEHARDRTAGLPSVRVEQRSMPATRCLRPICSCSPRSSTTSVPTTWPPSLGSCRVRCGRAGPCSPSTGGTRSTDYPQTGDAVHAALRARSTGPGSPSTRSRISCSTAGWRPRPADVRAPPSPPPSTCGERGPPRDRGAGAQRGGPAAGLPRRAADGDRGPGSRRDPVRMVVVADGCTDAAPSRWRGAGGRWCSAVAGRPAATSGRPVTPGCGGCSAGRGRGRRPAGAAVGDDDGRRQRRPSRLAGAARDRGRVRRRRRGRDGGGGGLGPATRRSVADCLRGRVLGLAGGVALPRCTRTCTARTSACAAAPTSRAADSRRSPVGEDVALVRALERAGAIILRTPASPVLTSARRMPRARGGFGDDIDRLASRPERRRPLLFTSYRTCVRSREEGA